MRPAEPPRFPALLWQYAHLLFVLAYIVASAGLSSLVLAGDVAAADPHDLTHHYEERSEARVPVGIRYFYCHGLALALLGMGLVALSHDHKCPPTRRLPKPVRLGNRAAACVVLFLLPLARRLSSLALVAVTVGLTFWVLLFELVGLSCRDDPFVGSRQGCCVSYQARCSRKELAAARRRAEEKVDGSVEVVALDQNEKVGAEIQG
jgi:hypothetical protein